MFRKEMQQYVENLEALRDFVGLIAPFLTDQLSKQTKADAKKLMPLTAALKHLKPDIFKDLNQKNREALEKQTAEHPVKIKLAKDGNGNRVELEFLDPSAGEDFRSALQRLHSSLEHQVYLYRSALISLISSVEWFLGSLLHIYYDKHPELAPEKRIPC